MGHKLGRVLFLTTGLEASWPVSGCLAFALSCVETSLAVLCPVQICGCCLAVDITSGQGR